MGASFSTPDNNDNGLLLRTASAHGDLHEVDRLLRQCLFDVAEREATNGFTALHYAALNGHAEVVRLLIEVGGASVETTTSFGETPLDLAQRTGHNHIVHYLSAFVSPHHQRHHW